MNGWEEAGERLITASREVWEQILNAPPLTGAPREVFSVTKLGALVPAPTDMLMDEGLIPDTRPARAQREPVRVTSWTLARSRARTAIAAARLRAGCWVAGVDLDGLDERDDEDDW